MTDYEMGFIAFLSVTSISSSFPLGQTTNVPRTSSSSELSVIGTWQDLAWDSPMKILFS